MQTAIFGCLEAAATTREGRLVNSTIYGSSIRQRANGLGKLEVALQTSSVFSSNPGNIPGGRNSAVSWVDGDGNFWIFGGNGFASPQTGYSTLGWLNDLWKFTPRTGVWAWMGGSSTIVLSGNPGIYGRLQVPATSNTPGSRYSSVSWTDNIGNLWLFGGWGFDSTGAGGNLSDLWEFDPSTGEWTWMGGADTSTVGSDGPTAIYGSLGVPSIVNIPGARENATSWTDKSGSFWLFGGSGAASGGSGRLNDLWEFSPSTNQWTWMSGSSAPEQAGVYGTIGVPDLANVPGARSDAVSWIDTSGNLWMFGGRMTPPNGGGQDFYFNDLWVFSPITRMWTWMGGGSMLGTSGSRAGVYGILGKSSILNIPGGSRNGTTWIDNNNLWFFGGDGFDSNGIKGSLNSHWVYQLAIAASPTFTPSTGTYTSAQTATLADTTPGATIYYTLDGTTPSALSTPYTGPFFITTNQTVVKAIATAPRYAPSALASALYSLTVATPTFSLASGTYATGQTVAISDSTVGSTIYYTVDGTTPSTSSPVYASPITVAQTETVQAIAVENGFATGAVATANYIIPSDFSMSINPILISVASGQSGKALIIVQSEFGFNSTVSFGCSGLPQGASCSFSPVPTSSSPGMGVTT